jgi:uncharacterized membrane protein YsdA (DUF1294 family)
MHTQIVLYCLLVINLLTFIAYGHDKWKAQHPHPHGNKRHTRKRTPEATLLLLAALGGSIGALLAMYLFRHKTLHKKFTIGVPILLLTQMALAVAIATYRL